MHMRAHSEPLVGLLRKVPRCQTDGGGGGGREEEEEERGGGGGGAVVRSPGLVASLVFLRPGPSQAEGNGSNTECTQVGAGDG